MQSHVRSYEQFLQVISGPGGLGFCVCMSLRKELRETLKLCVISPKIYCHATLQCECLTVQLFTEVIRTQGLSNNTLKRHCYQWPRSTYSTPHTLWRCAVKLASALTAATILADAAITPTVSEMTYNVSSVTLNHTQPNPHAL